MFNAEVASEFVHTQVTLDQPIPIQRTGALIMACNYSTADRILYVDESADNLTWTQMAVIGPIVPFGIATARVVTTYDVLWVRFRLDATADGDGVFVQITTPSVVARAASVVGY